MQRRRGLSLGRVLGLALVLASAAALAAWWRRPPAPLEVPTRLAERGSVEELVVSTTQGVVRPRRQVQVRATVPGNLRAVAVAEGDRVREGQVLAVYDDRVLAAQEAVAAAQAEASARLLAQARASAGVGALPPAELERVEDQAAVAARQAEAVRAQRTPYRVVAPFPGMVTRVLVEAGDATVPGAPMMELVDDGALHVQARIDETDLPRVREGQPVRVTLDAWPDDAVPGQVGRIAEVVTQEPPFARTVSLEIALPGAAGTGGPRPRPGMSADVEIVVGQGEGVVVPTVAVFERDGERYAWVVVGGRLQRRRVEIAAGNWEWTAVSAGIEPGDRVVVATDTKGLAEGRAAVDAAEARAAGPGRAGP